MEQMHPETHCEESRSPVRTAVRAPQRATPPPRLAALSTPAGSFDHLVGTGEQDRRHVKAKGLGGLQVDYQLVFGRRLYGQVGWLLTLEDAIDVSCCTAVWIVKIGPIRHETP